MQTTSDSNPQKRTRAKAKSDPTKPTVTVKKPRVRKATVAASEPLAEAAQAHTAAAESTQWNEEQISGMIATAAYFIAAERGFGPGRELDDWLEAERRIRMLCFG